MSTCSTPTSVIPSDSSNSDSLLSFTFQSLNYPLANVSTLLTGVRAVVDSTDMLISGFYTNTTVASNNVGFIYQGNFTCGDFYVLNHPGDSVINTALYGPNSVDATNIQVVGDYATVEHNNSIAVLYQGPLNGTGTWTDLNPQALESNDTVIYSIAHSTMGGLAVGNYDTLVIQGKGFLYNIATETFYQIQMPQSISTTVYGIWYNGADGYTIAGGCVFAGSLQTAAYLADWNSTTNVASNWKPYYSDNTKLLGRFTHFEGITADGHGGYNLVSDTTASLSPSDAKLEFVNIGRSNSGGFGTAKWFEYSIPANLTFQSANTIIDDHVIGVYILEDSNLNLGYLGSITNPDDISASGHCSLA